MLWFDGGTGASSHEVWGLHAWVGGGALYIVMNDY